MRLTAIPIALALSVAAMGQDQVLRPGDNLVVEGIPPIPMSVVQDVGRYTEFRSAVVASWHPTRREMLVRTRFANTQQVHQVSNPLGSRYQLTFFPDRVGTTLYEPTRGDYFVFAMDTGGDEFAQLYRYDVGDGRVTLLTDGKSRNNMGVWSNNGRWLAYGSTRRTGQDVDVWIVDPLNPKSDRMVVQLEGGGWWPLDWSPDDRTLLVAEYISINESYFWLVDVATGEKRLLTPKGRQEPVSYGNAVYSRDGRSLYLTTDIGGEFQRLARYDLASGRYHFLTTDRDWDVSEIALSRDGRTLAFLTNQEGISRLHLMDTRNNRMRQVSGLPIGVISSLGWHNNNRELAFNISHARSSTDAYSLDTRNNRLERWTRSEMGGLNPERFSIPELVRWKSFDGLTISGFLYMPPAEFKGKRPVIIDIHGGPESQSRPSFMGRDNYFINEMGLAIIEPNVRGSSGFGKTFLQLDNVFLRENSYRDIEALIDWIAAHPDLDENRIMVTGGSYGGHMTLAVATRYSDRIAAALSVVGMSNLVSFLENTQGYRRDLRRVEYGDERDPKVREYLLGIAPLTHAEKIRKPLMIVQGANDPRVPLSEAEQMVETLRRIGTPVWYLMAKDEGHGFAKKANADFQFYATVMFIREHLLK